jgi:DNA-binding GntR family transcriptional regulator
MTPEQRADENSLKKKGPAPDRGKRPERAYQQLRELIVRGQLSPGSRIVEVDLASRLGVSRTPVRDALRLLQQERFIVAVPGNSYKARLVVAPLTKEDARELYSVVGRLEGLAARHAAQLGPPARAQLVTKLRTLNDGLGELARAGRQDPNRIFELDRDFHRQVVEASAGPRLLAIHNTVKPQAERYWRLYAGAILDQLQISVAEHEEIIQAIEQGDAEAADRAAERNWMNGAERLCGVINALGERGSW